MCFQGLGKLLSSRWRIILLHPQPREGLQWAAETTSGLQQSIGALACRAEVKLEVSVGHIVECEMRVKGKTVFVATDVLEVSTLVPHQRPCRGMAQNIDPVDEFYSASASHSTNRRLYGL